MNPRPDVSRFLDLDFEIVRQAWGKYKLEDKAVLRTCVLLLKVMVRQVDPGKEEMITRDEVKVVVGFVPPEFWGQPSATPPSREQREAAEKTPVNFMVERETVSEYVLSNGNSLIMHYNPYQIHRVSLCDQDGEPMYMVRANKVLQLKPTTPLIGPDPSSR